MYVSIGLFVVCYSTGCSTDCRDKVFLMYLPMAREMLSDLVSASHPDEPQIDDAPLIRLRSLPLYILVKLDRTKASILPGLDSGVVPIEPRTTH